MARSKKTGRKQTQNVDPRQGGLQAFTSGNYNGAIALWSQLKSRDETLTHALAEAYFRRAIHHSREHDAHGRLEDLREAIRLVPDETTYQYHLAMALHLTGEVGEALPIYRRLALQKTKLSGLPRVLMLAELSHNPAVDLTAIPGSTPDLRAWFAPVQALLKGQPVPKPASIKTDFATFWYGLYQIHQGEKNAIQTLNVAVDSSNKPSNAIGSYYIGVSNAQHGKTDAALESWLNLQEEQQRTQGWIAPWVKDNTIHLLVNELSHLLEEGSTTSLQMAGSLAGRAARLNLRQASLNPLLVQALDHDAQRAVRERGDWERAVNNWEMARAVVGNSSNLGSPRSLLHNLAIGYEMLDMWELAAESWRTMLRTRPRQSKKQDEAATTADPLAYTDEQWSWVRRRVIECYKQAGDPAEAVKVFRQTLKAEPDDLDMRLQLAEALLANEQYQASINELNRILNIDPDHIEAYLRLAELYDIVRDWTQSDHVIERLVELNPQDEALRRRVVRVLLAHGQEYQRIWFTKQARKVFEKGRTFAPEDYRFPLSLARLAIEENNLKTARPLLSQVLELAADDPDAYSMVVECWLVAGDLQQARTVLQQAEERLSLGSDFYVELGRIVSVHSHPQPPNPLDQLFGGLKSNKNNQPDEHVRAFASEIFNKAIAVNPDDTQTYLEIAANLIGADTELALEYAQQARTKAPEEPRVLIMIGLLLGIQQQDREAREVLRKAERIARKNNDPDAARRAADLRQQVGSPLFSLGMPFGPAFGGLDPDDFDFDDLDDEDFF